MQRQLLLRRITLALVVVVTLLPGLTTRAAAGDTYVSPGGSDLNDCLTPATACATVPAAFAKATAGATVYIAVGTYTGSGNALLTLNKNMAVSGGWDDSFTTQTGLSTLDGEDSRRVIDTWDNCLQPGGVAASLDHLRITRGSYAATGAGIYVSCTTLQIKSSEISDHYASDYFGGAAISVRPDSSVVLQDSLVRDGRVGGAHNVSLIHSAGTLTIVNSTIAAIGDQAGVGQGLRINGGDLTLRQVTVTGFARGLNMALANVAIANSILNGNTELDCFRDTPTSGTLTLTGRNLVGTQRWCGFRPIDLVGVDAKLTPLADNGGPTATAAIGSDSPALGAGLNCESSPLTDQRGAPRPAICSLGAYEPTMIVTKSATGLFKPGETVTYTLQIAPATSTVITNAVVVDSLTAPLVAVPGSVTASAGSGQFAGNTLTWSGPADPLHPTTVTFQAQIDVQAPLSLVVNRATAQAQGFVSTSNTVRNDTYERQYLPGIASEHCRDFSDTFSDAGSGWPVFDRNLRRLEYLNGEYRLTTKQSGYIYLMEAPTCPRRSYRVQADMHWQGVAGSDIGLVYGDVGGAGYVYLATLDTNAGKAYVFRFNPDGTATLPAEIDLSGVVRPGAGTNQLALTIHAGAEVSLEVNGHSVTTLSGQAPAGLSWVGLAAAPYLSQPVVDARFDNFAVTQLTPAPTGGATRTELTSTWPGVVRPWRSIAPDAAP